MAPRPRPRVRDVLRHHAVELGGIEPPSISRWTNPLRPFPTSRLTLPHRRVGWIIEMIQRRVFARGQPSFRLSVVFPTVISRFCCRAAGDRPRVASLLTMSVRHLKSGGDSELLVGNSFGCPV